MPAPLASPRPIVIWGAGGHAAVVADILRLQRVWKVAGFLDDANPARQQTSFGGATILGGAAVLEQLRREGVEHAVVAIGDSETRIRLGRSLRANGFVLATAVHPTAIVASGASIGGGTVIAATAVIGADAQVGEHVIVNTAATLDHHCVVGDGAHVCPGVHAGGGARIGAGAWIGIGATIVDGVTIGTNTMVGAGAVVVRSLPDDVVAYGCPARVIRPR
jgi:acetyltransferase EpsM